MLDPQAQALLQAIAASGAPPIETMQALAAREFYRARKDVTQPDPPALHRVTDHRVTASDSAYTVREYQPVDRPAGQLLPALLYLHGGGWTIGDLETHDVLCRSLSQQAGIVVLSVDYRLAPEHRFPAAFDDSLSAFHWAVSNANSLSIDPARIAIGGDSAGGNLAAAVGLALRQETRQAAFQLLIYPATDMHRQTPSYTRNGQGYMLGADTMRWFCDHYIPQRSEYADWRASPLLANSLVGAPPALVLTAGFDPLRDDGLLYADALSAAGVPTEYVCFERQIHGFILMGRVLREANTAVQLCADALKRALFKQD